MEQNRTEQNRVKVKQISKKATATDHLQQIADKWNRKKRNVAKQSEIERHGTQ